MSRTHDPVSRGLDASVLFMWSYHEASLYGTEVCAAFAEYCFWRQVVQTQDPAWLVSVPVYFRSQATENPDSV